MGRKDHRKKVRSKARQRSHRPTTAADRRFQQKTRLLIDAAQVAWQRRLYERAIELYTEALRRDPQNPVLMVDLARAHGLRRDYEQAESLLDRAMRVAPRKAKVHCMLARSYFKFGHFEKAGDCYRNALTFQPHPEETLAAYLQLVRICERLHRLDEAREAVDRALALQPDSGEARYLDAVLHRRNGESCEAEYKLRALLAGSPSPQLEGDAWYELGRILDARSEYDDAMQAILRAKSARCRMVTQERDQADQVARRNERLLETIDDDHFRRWSEQHVPDAPLRSAVITSHARSGTTLLEQVLDSHPDLISMDEHPVMSDEVFTALGQRTGSRGQISMTEMLDRTTPEDLAAVRETYRRHSEAILGEPLGQRMLIDKNPELTLLLPVVHRVFPEMKVIFPLRDPRDVCLSCFMQPLPVNSVSVHFLTLEQTVQKYAMTMRTWLKVRRLTRADWAEIRYEETVADLEGQARRLLNFLGVPWQREVLEFYKRAREKHVRSPTYEAVTRPAHTQSIGRWKHYEKYLAPHMETLQPYLEEFQYS